MVKPIKDNPPLSLLVVSDKITTPFATFIVSPTMQKIAAEISDALIRNIFRFEIDGKKLTIEQAIEQNLIKIKIFTEERMEDNEWILITENDRYYSKGDNTN